MICGLPILNYQEIGEFFLDKELQLLIVDKKVSFDGNNASFNNSYFCNNMLPKDIIFEHLDEFYISKANIIEWGRSKEKRVCKMYLPFTKHII